MDPDGTDGSGEELEGERAVGVPPTVEGEGLSPTPEKGLGAPPCQRGKESARRVGES